MIVSKKWVAAGSTATLLAGGLFLGAPLASAAPGDAACLQASTQFEAALAAAGINADFVNQLELATDAVVAAEGKYEAIATSLGLEALYEEAERTSVLAEAAQEAVAAAQEDVDEAIALATAEDVDADGNPENDQRVTEARALLDTAQQPERDAVAAGTALEAALSDSTIIEAEQELEDAALRVDTLLGQVGVDDATADQLLGLFEAFLAACDASTVGTDPLAPVVVPVPVPVVVPATPVTPVVPAPVVTLVSPVIPAAPVAPAVVPDVAPVTPVAPVAPAASAPVATNKGLNVQTAVVSEDGNRPALALIAALLAVGVAVPAATAARMRRLERVQR